MNKTEGGRKQLFVALQIRYFMQYSQKINTKTLRRKCFTNNTYYESAVVEIATRMNKETYCCGNRENLNGIKNNVRKFQKLI